MLDLVIGVGLIVAGAFTGMEAQQARRDQGSYQTQIDIHGTRAAFLFNHLTPDRRLIDPDGYYRESGLLSQAIKDKSAAEGREQLYGTISTASFAVGTIFVLKSAYGKAKKRQHAAIRVVPAKQYAGLAVRYSY